MFDSIAYKNGLGPGRLIDIGALAEGLLFYRRVVVIGNSATLKDLLAQIPPFILLSLLQDGRLEFHYLEQQMGISTNSTSNGQSIHGLVQFSSPDHSIEKIGPRAFKEAAGSTGQAIVGASRFTQLLRPMNYSGFDQESMLLALSDQQATETSVKSLIQTVVPDFKFSGEPRFRIEREHERLHIDTDLDFVELNRLYHKTVPASHSTITEAYILSLMQRAYEATFFAASLDTEIAVDPLERSVQGRCVEAVVRRNTRSKSQIESFMDLTLEEGHAIREAVNSGVVSFSSVVKLLDSADKFRHWLHQHPIDSNLVKSYYQEVVKESWVERLPGKSARWSIFTGIGLGIDSLGASGLGTAAAVAVSAVDSFLGDKLAKGWKPHQFVEGDLKALFPTSREKR